MTFILDAQGFKAHGNRFIFKEVAIIPLRSSYDVPSVYLFKPPYGFARLSPLNMNVNRWLERNYHRLKWHRGDISYDELESTLKRALCEARRVYVKGAEKIDWIRKYTSAEIIDFEQLGCPALKNMKRLPACAHHSLNIDSECAVSNVLALKQWMDKDVVG
ncbi:hypothetical protein TKK_0017083 [Trichogramma kaykai]